MVDVTGRGHGPVTEIPDEANDSMATLAKKIEEVVE
jgi:hypothetical protein